MYTLMAVPLSDLILDPVIEPVIAAATPKMLVPVCEMSVLLTVRPEPTSPVLASPRTYNCTRSKMESGADVAFTSCVVTAVPVMAMRSMRLPPDPEARWNLVTSSSSPPAADAGKMMNAHGVAPLYTPSGPEMFSR